MPLSYVKVLENGTRVALWNLTEPAGTLLDRLAAGKVAWEGDGSGRRERERMAVRLMLEHLLEAPGPVSYAVDGSPFLRGSRTAVSISHSGAYVAVAVSDDGPVGVDVQVFGAHALVKGRDYFLSAREQETLGGLGETHALYLYWAVKESVFKCCTEVTDLRNHLEIEPLDISPEGAFSCRVLPCTPEKSARGVYWFTGSYVLAVTSVAG